MKVDIIAIGDEVLYGFTVNSNAAFLSSLLMRSGVPADRHIVTGDTLEEIKEVLKAALLRGSMVLITGGLGPTCDDLTRKALSELLSIPLHFDKKLFLKLKEKFGDITPLEDQATQLVGACLLENNQGTASGFILENVSLYPHATVVSLPGVPEEMKEMAERYIPELIAMRNKERRLFIHPLYFASLKEMEVDPLLRDLEKRFKDLTCGIYPGNGTLTVHLKAFSDSEEQFYAFVRPIIEEVKKAFSFFIYSCPSGKIEEAFHLHAIENKIKVATAESCTGGALASRLVSLSDASSYFQGGIVAYSNKVKTDVLGVPAELIEKYGAVSEEVVRSMAERACHLFKSDVAIAVSGIAGPKGGSDEKPVGSIWVAIHTAYEQKSWRLQLRGNRMAIIEKTGTMVLAKALLFLRGISVPS